MIKEYFSRKVMVCWISALLFAYCKIPYDPPLKTTTESNFLVVEGFIDGTAATKIKLSRTRMLSAGDTAAFRNEISAIVLIEDDHQNTYPLNEMGKGIYMNTNTLNLNADYQYRLHIFTSNGKEYLSDFVPFKKSPSIDSIGWKLKDNGVQIFVNTHDMNDATKYYRWEYKETWEFHSAYESYFKYNPGNNTVTFRTDQVHICWNSANSSNILLGSSAKLASDVINEMPLVFLELTDKKLSVLYSIWVKQYALDINGYNYWEAMRNNTEKVGSIFDPQPNQTVGNIHCTTDASETVVGYISAGSSIEKRIFISSNSIPVTWNPFTNCEIKTVPDNPDSLKAYFGVQGLAPISETMLGYSASHLACVDCTVNGSNIKPDFWP